MPLSIADNSRMELAKIVVSTAILLLTFKIRFDDLLNRFVKFIISLLNNKLFEKHLRSAMDCRKIKRMK